jgi:uncharacterized protein YdeI (YjbR/CyaY-like superfamily)
LADVKARKRAGTAERRAASPRSAGKPTFFPNPQAFRAWLEAHHRGTPELLVGFYKRDTGLPSITWPESVDQALCFGWIDGVRRRIDDRSYSIRFSPRRASSVWSAVNTKRMAVLQAEGLVRPAGLEAFARKSEQRSQLYSYENRHSAEFSSELLERFRANKKAWAFFEAQPPGYRHITTFYVMGAKRAETREKRLATLIELSANGRRLGL